MSLSLRESRAVSGLADTLYDFLPGSGRSTWKGHVNLGTVAASVGLGDFWQGGSKKPAINRLLTLTLEQRRHLFEKLVLEIVRCGINYREKENNPITRKDIEDLNGHVLELSFKFHELWDEVFLSSLAQSTTQHATENVKQAEAEQRGQSSRMQRAQELLQLKEEFLQLSAEVDRNKAGLALERLLNRLFKLFDLNPREPFRVVGEQIDGSFELDGQIYLLEAKWEKAALSEQPLLVFRGKIEGKSTFTRGVFIALNDITSEARDAITRGKSPSFFIMNGHDLMMILCEAISLTDFLKRRIRRLAEEGRVCIPFSEISA